MNEIGNLFIEARDATVKILKAQDVTNSELESLFKAYSYTKNVNQSNSPLKSADQLLEAMDIAIERLISHFTELLKNKKTGFMDILIEDILDGKSDLKSIYNNPYQGLSNTIEINDEETKSVLNDLLKSKIDDDLLGSDFSTCFEPLQVADLQKIIKAVESMDYLHKNIKEAINTGISNALFGKIAPELERISSDFGNGVTEAIKKSDSSFDAGSYKNKFIETVRDIENDKVVRGSPAEELLKKCKSAFETKFDKSVSDLVSLIIESKLLDELEDFDTESEIDIYLRSGKGVYNDINNLIKEINDEEIISKLTNLRDEKVEEARLTCKSRPPKVKITTDSVGNEYAHFGTEAFPVAHRETKKSTWRIEPKKLPDGNVLITFRDPASGKVIEPKGRKTMRAENPYEMSRSEYVELDKQISESNKLLKKIEDIKQKLDTTTDDSEREKLKKELSECVAKIPHFVKVRNKLRIFNKFMGDYIQDKVPDFDPDTIKITPDIMENLREIAECSKTMLLGEKDALIIEGEAGVGKNVLIDIFAHYTNRPVFVFACGKKTDAHDLNYQWILDENGSKKLNSKVYEAIRTPGAILVLDEINTLDAGVIKSLNGLFDRRKTLVAPEAGGGDAKALSDVLLFGTMNPVGYAGTQQLPQDVASRFHFIKHDYDWLFDENGGVSYSDALRTYGNVNYFWKILAGNGMRKQDVELYEEALLDKKVGNKLSKEKQKILDSFKPITDTEFIRAWNQLFNLKGEQEVIDRFGDKFVEGMKDIYDIVLYSNYIRMRHKICKSGVDTDKFPWDEDSNDLFDEKSFSPRLVIQALEQLNNGNEIHSAEEAVIQTYIQQVSDVEIRAKIVKFFKTLSKDNIKKQLNNAKVKGILFGENL